MEMNKQTKSYQSAYLKDHHFESVMVAMRQGVILDFLKQYKPKTVLEIGCGPDLLYEKAVKLKLPIKRWLIVEPCEEFVSRAKNARGNISLQVIHGFFEKSIWMVRALSPKPIDLIVCSGMLNEIKVPDNFLRAVKGMMTRQTLLHINVPNAGSLHRRLGVAMKLLKAPDASSSRNKRLMQYHVFDQIRLKKLVEQNGLVVQDSGGYFLKPFSHKQMDEIKKVLTPKVLEGLNQVGKDLPDLATEIYTNVKLKR